MSIFISFVNNVKDIFSNKKIHDLIYQYNLELEKKQKLLELNKIIEGQLNELTSLNHEMLNLINGKDINYQNKYAQKQGLKSAAQLKAKIKTDQCKFNAELNEVQKRKKENQLCISRSEEKIKTLKNTLIFQRLFKLMLIFSFLISIVPATAYIILFTKPTLFFKSNKNYIIYVLISLCTYLVLDFIVKLLQIKLYKHLKKSFLEKILTLFPFFILINLLFIGANLNFTLKIFVLLSFSALVVSMLLGLINNCKNLHNDRNYVFHTDFVFTNLPFASLSAIAFIDAQMINSKLFSTIISIIYVIAVSIYFILFVWEFINRKKAESNFISYILTIINIIAVCVYSFIAIVNFTNNFSSVLNIVGVIGGIISLFTPLFKDFKRDIR